MKRSLISLAAALLMSTGVVATSSTVAGAEDGCYNGFNSSTFVLAGGGNRVNENDAWRFAAKRTNNIPGDSALTVVRAFRFGNTTGSYIENYTSKLNTYTGRLSSNYPSLRRSEQVINFSQYFNAYRYYRSCNKV